MSACGAAGPQGARDEFHDGFCVHFCKPSDRRAIVRFVGRPDFYMHVCKWLLVASEPQEAWNCLHGF